MPPKKPAKAISLLHEERELHAVRQHILGVTRWLENQADQLDRPDDHGIDWIGHHDHKWAIDKLMVLKQPGARAKFLQMFVGQEAIFDAGLEMIDALQYLHDVQQEVIGPHLNADGNDVQRLRRHASGVSVADRAVWNGLTLAQQIAYEKQHTASGALRMAPSERSRLRESLRDVIGK